MFSKLPKPQVIALIVLIVLTVLHVAVSWHTIVPGYLLIDEAFYHWMTRDFTSTGGLELWNGYTEFPSPELTHRHVPVHLNRLVAQWPHFFAIIAAPLYLMWGLLGLYVLNVIAFIGVVWFCFLSANKLFQDPKLALNACLLLVFATFAWEYSQAIWPHSTALFFIMAAFYMTVCALYAQRRSNKFWLAIGAGLICGFATGIRMDTFLATSVVVLPFLFARPWRPVEAALALMGTLPGLTILAYTNYIKFNHFSPFRYGHGHGIMVPYPLIAIGACIIVLMWVLTRQKYGDIVYRWKWAIGMGVLTIAIVLFIIPHGQDFVKKYSAYAYLNIVDLRNLNPDAKLPSMSRTPRGGVVYIGALKKSLVQSIPYLPLVLLAGIAAIRRRNERGKLAMVSIIPLAFLGYYTLVPLGWGGLCLNLRYFLPTLPFICILCAYSLKIIKTEWQMSISWLMFTSIATITIVLFFLLIKSTSNLEKMEFPVLVVPLIIAGVLTLTLVLGDLISTEGTKPLRTAATVILVVGITWAGLLALSYDYRAHYRQRLANYLTDLQIADFLVADSLFISHPFLTPSIVGGNHIRIAFPGVDKAKDLPRLVTYHLKKGRRVFSILPPRLWRDLEFRILKDCVVKPELTLSSGVVFGEINLKP